MLLARARQLRLRDEAAARGAVSAYAFAEPKKLLEVVPKLFPVDGQQGATEGEREVLSGVGGESPDDEFVKGWWKQNQDTADEQA